MVNKQPLFVFKSLSQALAQQKKGSCNCSPSPHLYLLSSPFYCFFLCSFILGCCFSHCLVTLCPWLQVRVTPDTKHAFFFVSLYLFFLFFLFLSPSRPPSQLHDCYVSFRPLSQAAMPASILKNSKPLSDDETYYILDTDKQAEVSHAAGLPPPMHSTGRSPTRSAFAQRGSAGLRFGNLKV